MSDTERLEAAAAKLERTIDKSRAEDRAVAELLRQVGVQVAEVDSLGFAPIPGHKPTGVIGAALAVADAVLGVPASPKEQAP